VASGSPVAQLADFSAWQIETDDLTELGVVEIDAGSPVTISVDAIPELELAGRVTSIKPIGENKRGDITYTVIVEPQGQDERLRWNMTTVVSIEPSSGEGLAQSQR
jgi:HlyD family secretion protein